jgi:hypothetical protein
VDGPYAPTAAPQAPAAARDATSESDHYCPLAQLASFALLMAGHGRCVNTDMMLGDRGYALRQLAGARALHDPELAQVVARLARYFDDPQRADVA